MKNKILLINAINPNIEVEQRQPSLGLGYLASSLRRSFGKEKFDFRVIDRNIEEEIREFRPLIVLISSVTQNFDIAIRYAGFVKQQKIPVIIGGIHISVLPSNLNENFDIGVIGEGEAVIVDLFELFLKKNKFVNKDLGSIKGILFRDGDSIHFTGARALINDLDSIQLPARDLLKIERHTYMFSSRGCPYKCIFCASTRFWDKVRLFSPEYVSQEIRELAERYKVSVISLYDDLFIADKKRLEKIVGLLGREKFIRKVSFTCNCRANLVTDEVVGLLKNMNVRSINLGLESGCEKTLRYLKGNVSVEQNYQAIKIIKRHGIACQGSFIIGSPFESEKDIAQTYDFIKKSPLNLIDVNVLTPFPGTPVWDYANSRGLVSENMDWSKLNVNFSSNIKDAIILSEVLNKKDIVKLFKKIMRLRFIKNILGVLNHPYRRDVPKMALKLLRDQIHKAFCKKDGFLLNG